MLDDNKKLTVDGVEYPVEFSLNVMEKIQEKYETLAKWSETIKPEDETKEPSIKDIIWMFTEMINEGIEIQNDENKANRELLTSKQVGRIITKLGISKAADAIMGIAVNATQGDEKNLTTTQNPPQ